MTVRSPILLTVVFAAGLATGLSRFWAPVCVAAALALLAREPSVRLLAAAGLLGAAAGLAGWAREAGGCAARLPQGRVHLAVRLLEPADRASGRIAVRPVGAGCHGTILARWPSGRTVPTGRIAAVTARWVPRAGTFGRPGGTLTVQTVDSLWGTPGPAERLRTAIVESSRRLYGRRAPLVEALVLGRRGGLDRDLQDRFAESGLVHILSISGFHVGLVSAWVFLLCRLARVTRGGAAITASAVSVAYVAFLGWPAPATRAAALAVLAALCQVRQRRVRANALLSATCLCVLLVDPWAVVDLGGWLSATALWGATTFTRWSDRELGPQWWWRGLASSVGATLATAPITSAMLGAVAPVGILLNYAAIPLAAVAVPGVLASLIADLVYTGAGTGLAAGSGLALHLLEAVAILGARIPGGHVVQAEELRSALPWVGALAVCLWGMGRRNPARVAFRRWAWAVTIVLWAVGVRGMHGASGVSASELSLHFLDVGQGDATAIRTPAGRWVLVDAGPADARWDAGRRIVAPFLRRQGVRRISVVVVSHAHADHLGGVGAVLDRLPAGIVVEPGVAVADSLYAALLGRLDADGIAWHPARRGERFELDGVRFTVLHPDTAWAEWGFDLNEDSVVLLVEYGAFQAVLTGDIGLPAERLLRGRVGAVDLLKVGHHGSRGSTGAAWLTELRPKVAVVPVGVNRYGHPAPETLARLAAAAVDVRRTDRDGAITVVTDGRTMRVHDTRGTATYPVE